MENISEEEKQKMKEATNLARLREAIDRLEEDAKRIRKVFEAIVTNSWGPAE